MELTRTCCFEFDRKRRPGCKVSFLRNIPFYFMVAGFTYWSLHPVVDKKNGIIIIMKILIYARPKVTTAEFSATPSVT